MAHLHDDPSKASPAMLCVALQAGNPLRRGKLKKQ